MSDYPKMLHHPAWNPGVPAKTEKDAQGRVIGIGQAGIPCRYPPIEVRNEAQETEMRAKGYMSQGERATVSSYADFPKIMMHPDHVDAIPDAIDMKKVDDQVVRLVIPGTPEKFPHVFVENEDQEAEWREKGYELPGKPDPVHAVDTRVEHIEGYDPQQYPKMEGGRIVDPNAPTGGPDEYPKYVDGQIVNSYAEEMALKAPETEEGAAARVAAEKQARRERLLAELAALENDGQDVPVAVPALTADTPGVEIVLALSGVPHDQRREPLLMWAKAKGLNPHHKWGVEKLQEALKAA